MPRVVIPMLRSMRPPARHAHHLQFQIRRHPRPNHPAGPPPDLIRWPPPARPRIQILIRHQQRNRMTPSPAEAFDIIRPHPPADPRRDQIGRRAPQLFTRLLERLPLQLHLHAKLLDLIRVQPDAMLLRLITPARNPPIVSPQRQTPSPRRPGKFTGAPSRDPLGDLLRPIANRWPNPLPRCVDQVIDALHPAPPITHSVRYMLG